MRVRMRLIILTVSLVTIPCIFLSMIMFNAKKETITEGILKQFASISLLKKEKLNNHIREYLQLLNSITSRTQLRLSLRDYYLDDNTGHIDKIKRILSDTLSSIEDFEGIFVLNKEGRTVVSTTGEFLNEAYPYFTITAGALTQNNFYLQHTDNNKSFIILSSPLILNDKFLGMLIIHAKSDGIRSIVSYYEEIGATGDILLARRDQNEDAEFIAPQRFGYSDQVTTVPKEQVNIPITQALLENEGVFSGLIDYRGKRVIAATKYIDSVGWGLVVKVDEEEAFAALHELDVTMKIFGVTILLLTLLIAWLSSETISHPIISLHKASQGIAAGRFDSAIDSQVLQMGDEIGDLGRSFDQMTKKLVKMNLNLDNKVKERTEELQRSNQELEKMNRAMVGRENRMIELKKTIKQLQEKLDERKKDV